MHTTLKANHVSSISLEAKGEKEKELNRCNLSWSAIIPHPNVTPFFLVKKEGILRQKLQLKPFFCITPTGCDY